MENNYYLAHHGIIGQKWGVRRYQNSDGSLTPEGRRRRGLSEQSGVEKLKKTVQNVHKANQRKKAVKAKQKAEKRKNEEANEQEKLEAYLRRHPSALYRNRDKLPRETVDRLINDINFDRKCKDIRREEYTRGLRYLDDVKSGLKAVSDITATAVGAYNNGSLIYNSILDYQASKNLISPAEAAARKRKKIAWQNDNNANNKP